MERRLAAILAADVVGYSRLMEADEVGVLGALKSHRHELINPKIADHHGSIVKLMGDGALVEFASVVDAVKCALAIQGGMVERNAGVPKERRIDLRIGVHLGDVIVEGEDIYGDGVNIAARLEGLSQPGGICISQQAFDQIETKLDLKYEDLGDQRVKNIARLVHAYRIRLDSTRSHRSYFRKVPRKFFQALGAFLVLGLAMAIGWHFWSSEPASVRSSIAVLPFDNIGGEESNGRLADGITEDIITDLARFPEFEVVARHSVETLKGKAVDIRKVGKMLNVDYVLEGSIQRQEGRVRITAQLLDATSGTHLWSERWDRPVEDVFAVQTEIAELVTNRLGGGTGLVLRAERNLARRKRPENLTAYELYLLGGEKIEELTPKSIEESLRLLTRAVELDPGLARAWVELYHAHSLSGAFGIRAAEPAKQAALDAAKRAVALDPSDAEAHSVLGSGLVDRGELELAKASFDTSLRLAPNAFEILTFYAGRADTLGEAERGAEMADKAVRLNPNYPTWSAQIFGWTYFAAGRYEDAVQMLGRLAPENYGGFGWVARASALASLERLAEAEATVRQALERLPDLTIEGFLYEEGISGDLRPHLIKTMRLAGFPPCAKSPADLQIPDPERLPDCLANRELK
jgi:TolB-like protein/class 3 adenylate cyclase/tetratricopeptide (TPR) repeat protein